MGGMQRPGRAGLPVHMRCAVVKLLLSLHLLIWISDPALGQCFEHEHDQGMAGGLDFGSSVAISGDVAVVGVPRWFGSNGPGAAVIYGRQGAAWAVDAVLTGDNPFSGGVGEGDQFGFAVAVDGERVVIGAPYEIDAGVLNTGVVYIYKQDASGWIKEARIANPIPAVQDLFGFSVDIHGDRLVVGSPTLTSFLTEDVFIFKRSGAAWPLEQILVPTSSSFGAYFGRSVAIHDERILIGVPDYLSGTTPGRVAAYEYSGTQWLPSQVILPQQSSTKDTFGRAIAMDGDRAIIGGWHKDQAWIFHHEGGAWMERAHLTGPAFSHFGSSVAIQDDHALVGIPLWGTSAITGAVQTVRYDGATWIEEGALVATDKADGDEFGSSAALQDGRMIIGARRTDQLGVDSGSAYAYRYYRASLAASVTTLSLSAGGAQTMTLRGGDEHAGDIYLVVSSASGECPGAIVDDVYIPATVDALTAFSLANVNQLPYSTSLGFLDSSGEGVAGFQLPPATSPILTGLSLLHAGVILNPSTGTVLAASNAVSLSLGP